ncbi:hypothetical protein IFM89_004461 [Coptis chinensis]|uniref:Uncharacterized protein n=1 Tax=Coptis chinensis TaxID=261450 RepID=A0A835GV95_9MAGN|nr:hypothetical protein IFM89_004461 [Coptis chinensis]
MNQQGAEQQRQQLQQQDLEQIQQDYDEHGEDDSDDYDVDDEEDARLKYRLRINTGGAEGILVALAMIGVLATPFALTALVVPLTYYYVREGDHACLYLVCHCQLSPNGSPPDMYYYVREGDHDCWYLVCHCQLRARNKMVQRALIAFALFVPFWAVKKLVYLDNWKTGHVGPRARNLQDFEAMDQVIALLLAFVSHVLVNARNKMVQREFMAFALFVSFCAVKKRTTLVQLTKAVKILSKQDHVRLSFFGDWFSHLEWDDESIAARLKSRLRINTGGAEGILVALAMISVLATPLALTTLVVPLTYYYVREGDHACLYLVCHCQLSISSAMHNIIRKMPMFIADRNDPTKLVFFYQGNGMQLGAEGFTVVLLYMDVRLLLPFVSQVLVRARNKMVQRAFVVFAFFVPFWAVKKLVYLDNRKTGYNIHGYWPLSW